MATSRALVIGGSGALGRIVLQRFQSLAWQTCNVDVYDFEDKPTNILWPKHVGFSGAVRYIDSELAKQDPFDCIVCTAGGFAMGSPGDDDALENIESMMSVCLETAFAASHFAARRLSPNGLVVLSGAAAVLGNNPTPALYGYGATKAATHHIIGSLTQHLEGNGKVVGILPTMIDTPGNRAGMPDADFSSWTKCEDFANQIVRWKLGQDEMVSGGMYQFETTSDVTTVSLVS